MSGTTHISRLYNDIACGLCVSPYYYVSGHFGLPTFLSSIIMLRAVRFAPLPPCSPGRRLSSPLPRTWFRVWDLGCGFMPGQRAQFSLAPHLVCGLGVGSWRISHLGVELAGSRFRVCGLGFGVVDISHLGVELSLAGRQVCLYDQLKFRLQFCLDFLLEAPKHKRPDHLK